MSFVAPNWRIETEYPMPTQDANLSAWAWQFLRRNKKYQAAWDGYVKILSNLSSRIPELKEFIDYHCSVDYLVKEKQPYDNIENVRLSAIANKQLEYVHVDPPALPDEKDIDAYRRRIAADGGQRWSQCLRAAELGKEWGLERLQNPGISNLRSNNFLVNGARVIYIYGKNDLNSDNNFFTPLFDLRYPVDALRAQFEFMLRERATMIANKEISPYKGRPWRAVLNYRDYLRVLDAADCGTQVKEIAEIMLPKQDIEGAKKNINNWKSAAIKIRGQNYKLLPAYEGTAKKKVGTST